jgi:adenylosuccinate synthase
MPLDVVIGAQWGDEGKGRIVDRLASSADVVARVAGGDNAGHTIHAAGQILRLHLIPSGILHPRALCLLGAGMVVYPETLLQEIHALEAQGIDVSTSRLKLSLAAHIITPAHRALDAAQEQARGSGELGTTRRGIGPAYADKASRRGLRAEAMRDPEAFARSVEAHSRQAGEWLSAIYHTDPPDPIQAGRDLGAAAEALRPYLADVGAIAGRALAEGKTVLAEGAQGTLLDLDHGTYPFVTASSPTLAGALAGLGVGATHLRRVVGVAKSFQTRVGAGPFPTELFDDDAARLRGTGSQPWDEFGTTTARPRRCGWLDLVLLRYACRINGFTELALTKLDVLAGLAAIPLCHAYRTHAGLQAEIDDGLANLASVQPEYERMPGWETIGDASTGWEGLPPGARAYVERIERHTSTPLRLVSVGAEREALIDRGAG